jgi:2-polyprenyl-6-hydroxyphenyl methylase/3-demethylubiquinone-9 3-methyltransferase
LHKINPLRLRWIAQYGSLKDKHVLDVGCGAGLLSEGLAKAGAKVIGIDLAEDLIRVAKDHAQAAGLEIDYICQSLDCFGKGLVVGG